MKPHTPTAKCYTGISSTSAYAVPLHPARPSGLPEYETPHLVLLTPLSTQFRYSLLAQAGLEAPLLLDLGGKGVFGQDIVFVANDWHTSLVPVYLAANFRPFGVYTNARSLLTIHNLSHQV